MSALFNSAHNLDFIFWIWDNKENSNINSIIHKFRIGSCTGLFCLSEDAEYLDILAVKNNKKGNGHFSDVMQWFENTANKFNTDLRVLEVYNTRLLKHLINDRGFVQIDGNNVLKSLKSNP